MANYQIQFVHEGLDLRLQLLLGLVDIVELEQRLGELLLRLDVLGVEAPLGVLGLVAPRLQLLVVLVFG
jgi:hypothetical protein